MYLDISCYDTLETEETVRKALFHGLNVGFHGVSVFPYFVQSVKDFILNGVVLAVPIDYPYGISDPTVRCHAALSAIRKGANSLDVVANNIFLANDKWAKFGEDISSILNICIENGVQLRVLFEYRKYELEKIIKAANMLREIGVDYVFPGTGAIIDNWEDNLLAAIEIGTKADIKVITNGNIWKKSYYDSCIESKVYGIRLSSESAIRNVFGV